MVDRPLIQHVVDEAREAGIEHFIFVTGRNKAVIEDHFDRQFELEADAEGAQQARRPQAPVARPARARHHELHAPAVAARPRSRGLVRARAGRRRAVRAAAAGRAGAALAGLPQADDRGLERAGGERQHHRGRGGAARAHPSVRRRRRRQDQGPDFRDHRDGGEAHAREGALEPHHHRPLHPAAGDFRVAREPRRAAPAAKSRSPTP